MTGRDEDRVGQGRRAVRGETRWTPDLAYLPVSLTAISEEIRELRAVLDAIIPLVPGVSDALAWIHWDRKPCSGCGRPILWSITRPGGSKMPLQAVPNPDGDRLAWAEDGIVYNRHFERGDLLRPGAFRFVAHWADCPEAPSFKRTQAREKKA
jgi:hypothetical protein